VNHELLENWLTDFFEYEADQGDIPTDRWQRLILDAVAHTQRQRGSFAWGLWRFVSRRPLEAVATLVIAVTVGSIALWASGFLETNSPTSSPDHVLGIVLGPGSPGSAGTSLRWGPPLGPAPRYFDVSWSVGKRSYVPGESILITLTMENIYDQPIRLDDFSVTPQLTHMGIPNDGMTSLEQVVLEDVHESILPGEQRVVSIILPPVVTSKLATGRYSMNLDLRFVRVGEVPELNSETHLGMNSETLFVIVPPEGALIKKVRVGEAREAGASR
jgi:hypothetical protein